MPWFCSPAYQYSSAFRNLISACHSSPAGKVLWLFNTNTLSTERKQPEHGLYFLLISLDNLVFPAQCFNIISSHQGNAAQTW